ncbi:unnamed protein product, partial [Lampetra fluviatilis]
LLSVFHTDSYSVLVSSHATYFVRKPSTSSTSTSSPSRGRVDNDDGGVEVEREEEVEEVEEEVFLCVRHEHLYHCLVLRGAQGRLYLQLARRGGGRGGQGVRVPSDALALRIAEAVNYGRTLHHEHRLTLPASLDPLEP